MGIQQPSKGWRWLLTQAATFDIGTAGFTAIVGYTSAANYDLLGRRGLALVVFLATTLVLVLSVGKHIVTLHEARQKASMHELEGCLYTLHAALDPTAMQHPGRVRLAIHVPKEEDLVQVTEYIGDTPKPGRIGRHFPAGAGIIGKAYREKDVFVGRRVNDDYELYVQELVRDWNYTQERALLLKRDVMEWMAVPFIDPDRNRVEAVLYMDCNQREFFTPQRQELILSAVNGIAIFIGKRYS